MLKSDAVDSVIEQSDQWLAILINTVFLDSSLWNASLICWTFTKGMFNSSLQHARYRLNIFSFVLHGKTRNVKIMRKDRVTRHLITKTMLLFPQENMATHLLSGCCTLWWGLSLNHKKFLFLFHKVSYTVAASDWLLLSVYKMRITHCLPSLASKYTHTGKHMHPHMKQHAETRTLFAHRGQYPPQPRRNWHKQTRTAHWLKKLPANNAKWKDINI